MWQKYCQMCVGIAQCDDVTIRCDKKKKGITKYDKRIVTCNVGTVQCDDKTIKCEKKKKKKKETTKCEKITVTCNVGTVQCDDEIVKYEKKVRKLPNVRKELSHVIIEPSNVGKK